MKTLIKLIIIGIVIMCFSSCYNSKKATEQVNKADNKYPEIVAKLARDKYPCVKGVVKVSDSADYKKWKSLYEESKAFYDSLLNNIEPLVIIDSIAPDSSKIKSLTANNVTLLKQVSILRNLNADLERRVKNPPIIRDTVPIEDSAKLKLSAIAQAKMQAANEKLQVTNEKLQADNETLKSKIATRTKYLWWLLALCIGLIVWSLRELFI